MKDHYNMNYFDMAENDYQFLKFDIEHKRVGNLICYASHNICERYLKHIIDFYCRDINVMEVMKTHSIRTLKNFLSKHLEEFTCDWKTVVQVNGFYYSAQYPGEDSFIVSEEDVQVCWEAVLETRRAVMAYLDNNPVPAGTDIFAEYKNED